MNETLYGMIQKMSFMVEILFAELIYLYPTEKRKRFWLRFPVLFLICCIIAAVFPLGYSSILSQLLMFLLLFILSIAAMGLCFRLPVSALISCCVAGYATEHIAYHIAKIAGLFGFIAAFQPSYICPKRRLVKVHRYGICFFQRPDSVYDNRSVFLVVVQRCQII